MENNNYNTRQKHCSLQQRKIPCDNSIKQNIAKTRVVELELGALVAFLSAQERLYDPWKEL
ncbi:MAG: hypothetical protein ACO38R_02970, partial [Ilumatobacteraceae bacterium]